MITESNYIGKKFKTKTGQAIGTIKKAGVLHCHELYIGTRKIDKIDYIISDNDVLHYAQEIEIL